MKPQELFDSWLRTHNVHGRDPISALHAQQYLLRWNHWLRWLAEHPTGSPAPRADHYLAATPELLLTFLHTGRSPMTPANLRRRANAKPVQDDKPFSQTTQRRYWRTLERIYEHARALQLIAHNPAEVAHHLRPEPERTEATVVTPQVWALIPQMLPQSDHWLDVRDRAVVLVAMDAALTPGEICALSLSQVGDPPEHPQRLQLRITGNRTAQERTLDLGADASRALLQWLTARDQLKIRHPIAAERVFVSLRKSPLTRIQLYTLMHRAIKAAYEAVHGGSHGETVAPQFSPMTLRNTRLYMRLALDQEDLAQVARDAGFKDAHSFRGLLPRLRARG